MKPLIVLFIVFVISSISTKVIHGNYDFALSGRIALSTMLIFTGISHFFFTDGMAMMIPPFIPFKVEVVYLTGIIEIIAAIALFIPSLRILTAWLLIAFFVLILPANIYASIKQVDIQKATYDGVGLVHLWFRIPLQILFIIWTYMSSIKT